MAAHPHLVRKRKLQIGPIPNSTITKDSPHSNTDSPHSKTSKLSNASNQPMPNQPIPPTPIMSRILDRESGKGPIRLLPQNIYTIYDPTDLQKVLSNASLGSLIHYNPPNQQGSVTYQLVLYNETKVAVDISNYYGNIYHKLREPPYTFELLQENPAPTAANAGGKRSTKRTKRTKRTKYHHTKKHRVNHTR